MVPLTEKIIQHGLRTNTGQCLPVNLIAQSYIDYIEENLLDPEQTAVWVFESHVACNIRMYPQMIKKMFEASGDGMEKVDVYIGNLSMIDISLRRPSMLTLPTCSAACCARSVVGFGPMKKKRG